ncbi:hypothetical protein IFM89_013685 [Coptis chinensis]|uniref:PWWP domain-containing protein n=1 Tax=Coptis chinensis TaxID=261450 RepID=A0A835H0P4_9MAGN|nr:hypothetical protein IFM89_013685 [Coptis chinensis]
MSGNLYTNNNDTQGNLIHEIVFDDFVQENVNVQTGGDLEIEDVRMDEVSFYNVSAATSGFEPETIALFEDEQRNDVIMMPITEICAGASTVEVGGSTKSVSHEQICTKGEEVTLVTETECTRVDGDERMDTHSVKQNPVDRPGSSADLNSAVEVIGGSSDASRVELDTTGITESVENFEDGISKAEVVRSHTSEYNAVDQDQAVAPVENIESFAHDEPCPTQNISTLTLPEKVLNQVEVNEMPCDSINSTLLPKVIEETQATDTCDLPSEVKSDSTQKATSVGPSGEDSYFSEVQLAEGHYTGDEEQKIGVNGGSTRVGFSNIISGSLVDEMRVGSGEELAAVEEGVDLEVRDVISEVYTLDEVVLGGNIESFSREKLVFEEDTCTVDGRDTVVHISETVPNQLKENLGEICVTVDSSQVHNVGGQSETSCSSQFCRDEPEIDASVPRSADVNSFLEIGVTKGHPSEDEEGESGVEAVEVGHVAATHEVLVEQIQVIVGNGFGMKEKVEERTDAGDEKLSYVEEKQILEAEAVSGFPESLSNGILSHRDEISAQNREQPMVVESTEEVLNKVVGNETMDSQLVADNMNGRVCVIADSNSSVKVINESQAADACAFQSGEVETVFDQANESSVPLVNVLHEDQNIGTHLSEIYTSEEWNQTSDARGETDIVDGLSEPKVVESLDNFPCTDGNQNNGDEVKEMGDSVKSCLLDDSLADSVREYDSEIRQNVHISERATEITQANSLEEQAVYVDTLKPETSHGIEHAANYTMCAEKEGEFSVSDLVWGKVKSHPWWPGQIFDSPDASEQAMKYRKKDSFLVAYFGDQTFAWNEASSLKHFRTHFSLMEKQSNSESFHIAVNYALDEFCRRVELGMVCSCTPKAAYAKLLEYIKALAPKPCSGSDRLELKIAQAQLLAFYRLKGYSRLPEFYVYGGLLEENDNSLIPGERNQPQQVIEHEPPVSYNDEEALSENAKLRTQDQTTSKHEYGFDGGLHPSKKNRSLSELMAGKKASSRKRMAVDSFSEEALKSVKRMPSFSTNEDAKTSTPQSFKVGDCLRRIASQMTGSPPILKSSDVRFRKGSAKLEMDNEKLDGSGGSPYISEGSHRRRVTLPKEYSSPDEMLSQLCLAARDPMKGYSFLTTIVGFFTDFRNSISLELSNSGKHKRSDKTSGGKAGTGIRKPSNMKTDSTKTFDFEDMGGDSYWTDRVVQSSPEEQPPRRNRKRKEEYQFAIAAELDTSSFEAEVPVQFSLALDFEGQNIDENFDLAKEKPSRKYRKRKSKSQHVLPTDEDTALNSELLGLCDYDLVSDMPTSSSYEYDYVNEFPPAALLMSFPESGCIPSVMNLNKIFRRFGALKESETEVMRDMCSARVVFKKQSDAEVALSSAAKFGIFGPVHVSYQLRDEECFKNKWSGQFSSLTWVEMEEQRQKP